MFKKYLLVCVLHCSFAFGGDIMYGTDVKPVSLSADLKNVVGKLLPTNEIEVLENKSGVVKFAIKGYVLKTSPNIIYFTPKARILALSFAKGKTPKYEIIKSSDTYDEVKLIAYTDDKNLTKDIKALFTKSEQIYTENCGICHSLHKPSEYEANRLPALFDSMVSRTGIEKADRWAIKEWLQKHSKDVNINNLKEQ